MGGAQTGACPELAFHFFTVTYSFLGMFMVLSLVISVFEGAYTERHEQALAEERRKRRVGLLVAFYILDKNAELCVHCNLISRFLRVHCNTGLTFNIPVNLTLKAHEFIELMEELQPYCHRSTALRRRIKSWSDGTIMDCFLHPHDPFFTSHAMASCRGALQRYFKSDIHAHLMLFVSILNLLTLMFYPEYAVSGIGGARGASSSSGTSVVSDASVTNSTTDATVTMSLSYSLDDML